MLCLIRGFYKWDDCGLYMLGMSFFFRNFHNLLSFKWTLKKLINVNVKTPKQESACKMQIATCEKEKVFCSFNKCLFCSALFCLIITIRMGQLPYWACYIVTNFCIGWNVFLCFLHLCIFSDVMNIIVSNYAVLHFNIIHIKHNI